MIAARSHTHYYISEPVVVEAMSAFSAVESCHDMKSNLLLVVNAIKDYEQNWSRYGQIMEDMKRVLRALGS